MLDGVQLAAFGGALDGGEGGAFGLKGEEGGRFPRRAVEQDGARAALAGVAAHVRAGESEHVAEEMDEKQSGLDLLGLALSVDAEGDGGQESSLSWGAPRRGLRRSGGGNPLTPRQWAVNTRRGAGEVSARRRRPRRPRRRTGARRRPASRARAAGGTSAGGSGGRRCRWRCAHEARRRAPS